MRSLAVDVLADAGFETAEASNAAQALELLKNPKEDIDVLFTDVRMPGSMDGLELAMHALGEGRVLAEFNFIWTDDVRMPTFLADGGNVGSGAGRRSAIRAAWDSKADTPHSSMITSQLIFRT